MGMDKCICCGAVIPSGATACPNCLVVSKMGNVREEIDFDYAAEDDYD